MKLTRKYDYTEINETSFMVSKLQVHNGNRVTEHITFTLKGDVYTLVYTGKETNKEVVRMERTAMNTDNHWIKNSLKNLKRDVNDYEEQMRWVESLWHAGRDVFVDPFGSYAEKENVKA